MALHKTPVWRGAKGLTENEDSPEVAEDTNGLTVTQSFTGTYEACLNGRPVIASAAAGFGTGVMVESSRVKRAPGGRATLVVVSKRDRPDNEGGPSTATQSPDYDVDWARVDVPLARSDFFKDLTENEWKFIKAWQAGEASHGDRYGKFEYQLNGSGTWTALTGLALKYAQKIRAGIESVMVFTPVIRKSTPHSGPPTVGSCGKKVTPPQAISGYVYLKTADRKNRKNRRWTREEEWTGFEKLDDDLYPA